MFVFSSHLFLWIHLFFLLSYLSCKHLWVSITVSTIPFLFYSFFSSSHRIFFFFFSLVFVYCFGLRSVYFPQEIRERRKYTRCARHGGHVTRPPRVLLELRCFSVSYLFLYLANSFIYSQSKLFVASQVAGEVSDAKTNPMRAKKLYVLAALLVSLISSKKRLVYLFVYLFQLLYLLSKTGKLLAVETD